jgi:hypothetical protein
MVNRRAGGRIRWWIVPITFLAGTVAGVLVVGLLSSGTPDFVRASREAAANAPTPSDPAQFPVTSEARVNAACLRVINAAQDISTILSGVDEATNDVDLQRLDDIVRQLQPIENRLRADLTECQVDAIQSGGTPPTPEPSPVPTPEPTPDPSASPTAGPGTPPVPTDQPT